MKKVSGGKVQVRTPGGVKAKAATPENAAKQKRLLNAVEHGWKPDAAREALKKRVLSSK